METTTTHISDNDLATLEAGKVANQIISEWTLKYFYFIIGSVGLIGNIFVLVVILSQAGMRKTLTNIFITSQSFLDASVALFLILTTAIEDNGYVKSGLKDELFCRLWLTKMPLWGLLVSSTYNLVAMTFERYLAIVHPIWHKNKFSKMKAYICIAFAWSFGLIYNLAYMTPTARIQEDGSCTVYSYWPNELTQRGVGVLTIIIQYLLPLFLCAFCYIRMWRVLKLKVKPSDNTTASKKQDTMSRARGNIIKTLVLVVCSFTVCWTWNQIFFVLFNLGYPSDFTSPFYHFTVVMVFCNCCINPFIYIAKYEQFQTAAKKLLKISPSSATNATSASGTVQPGSN